jgi:hypothetical protein
LLPKTTARTRLCAFTAAFYAVRAPAAAKKLFWVLRTLQAFCSIKEQHAGASLAPIPPARICGNSTLPPVRFSSPLQQTPLTRLTGGLLELLGRQNSPARSFVIGSAGSGKTQLLLALARECTDAASSESLCLTPVFLKPGLVNESTSFNDTPMRFVENLLKSALNAITAINGMRIEDISTDLRSHFVSISSFAVSLTNAMLALCPARRLLLIYDANNASHKGDIAVLNQACRSGCHVIVSGQDDSVLDAWAIEESNCSSRASRPLPSLKLTMLQPERHFMVVGGVRCDPVSLLGERSCAGVRNWWLLHNAVRFHMLSTPHNRHIASGCVPPFGPALRLQTWNRLIFDSMNLDGTRLSAHSLLYAETSPTSATMDVESVRDLLLVLGRVAVSQKCGNQLVNDAAFITWLLAMPAYTGTSLHEARLVLLSLKRSGASLFFFACSFCSLCETCIRASRK